MVSESDVRYLQEMLPFWKYLREEDRQLFIQETHRVTYAKGEVIHRDKSSCTGVLPIIHGRLRIYFMGSDGKEITLYRLVEQDVCVLSASCVLRNITFDVQIMAEEATTVLNIPAEIYKQVEKRSIEAQDFTTQLVTSRFSDVMWVMEQVVFMSMDRRLAIYLQEQSNLAGSDTLQLTHETIAHDMGTAREVVTRLLRYFQDEKIVTLSRGKVTITDEQALSALAR